MPDVPHVRHALSRSLIAVRERVNGNHGFFDFPRASTICCRKWALWKDVRYVTHALHIFEYPWRGISFICKRVFRPYVTPLSSKIFLDVLAPMDNPTIVTLSKRHRAPQVAIHPAHSIRYCLMACLPT